MNRASLSKKAFWIAPETLVGIIIASIIILAVIAIAAMLYGLFFSGQDETLAINQLNAVAQKIDTLLKDPGDFASTYTVIQQPSDKGFFILGFGSGEAKITLTLPVQSAAQAKDINRPAAACSPSGPCICLYQLKDITSLFSQNVDQQNPEPIACKKFTASAGDVSFLSHVENPSLFSPAASSYAYGAWEPNPRDGALGPYYRSALDPRLLPGYYHVFMIGQDDKGPAKNLYIEKSVRSQRQSDGPVTQKTYVFIADYSSDIDKRQNALEPCPSLNSTTATACLDMYQRAIIDLDLCNAKKAQCTFDQASNACTANCISPCTDGAVTAQCDCGGQIVSDGICKIQTVGSIAAGVYYAACPAAPQPITAQCACNDVILDAGSLNCKPRCGQNIDSDCYCGTRIVSQGTCTPSVVNGEPTYVYSDAVPACAEGAVKPQCDCGGQIVSQGYCKGTFTNGQYTQAWSASP